MDNDFTHSNMELLQLDDDNNNMINPPAAASLTSLSNVVSTGHEEFTPNFPGNNFSIHHHQNESCGLPFIPLPAAHGSTNNNDDPSLDFSSSSDHHHQAAAAGSFNHPMSTHLADDHMIKRTTISSSRDEIISSLRNSNTPPANFISRENYYKTNRNNGHSAGGKRRKKNTSTEAQVQQPPREVVHVRARRGEATDSHSLAERLRREKINGKLRSLQELVPGCYKTMGMSVMLDITINYIRSLQNQIEFLSMKLSAASMFYDFNSAEMDALDSLRGANGYEAQVMAGGEAGYGEQLLQFQSTWPL